MPLVSMTGFSRVAGTHGSWRWAWELKSVNARGLDLRLRCTPGFDAVEAEARNRLAKQLGRGAVYVNLTAQRDTATPQVKLNEAALVALQEALSRVPRSGDVQPATMDGLLNIRGMVEITDAGDSDADLAAVHSQMLSSLDEAVSGLIAMRESEGAALAAVLHDRVEAIARLTGEAEECPGRKPEMVRARLEKSIMELSGAAPALDPARLHQEALLMAAKADVREELDRLYSHVDAVRALLGQNGPVGRRLDFLAQELGREANTLCSKSNEAALTAIGMELRVQIEQFREQVQNIE